MNRAEKEQNASDKVSSQKQITKIDSATVGVKLPHSAIAVPTENIFPTLNATPALMFDDNCSTSIAVYNAIPSHYNSMVEYNVRDISTSQKFSLNSGIATDKQIDLNTCFLTHEEK